MKVQVSFRQIGKDGPFSLQKTIDLAAVPVPGSIFDYQDGWAACQVVGHNESGMHLCISADEIALGGYGPRFEEDEIASLLALGWERTR